MRRFSLGFVTTFTLLFCACSPQTHDQSQRPKWRERWANLKTKVVPYGVGTKFYFSKLLYCPTFEEQYRFEIVRTVVKVEQDKVEFSSEEWNLTRPAMNLPQGSLLLPAHWSGGDRGGIDPSLAPTLMTEISVPAGTFPVVAVASKGNHVSHGARNSQDSHETERYRFYAPNIHHPILEWERDASSKDLTNPPISEDLLPRDSYYEWTILKSVEYTKPSN